MTTLSTEFLCIAPVSDLSDVTTIYYAGQSTTDSRPVSVRRYANGVRRAVSTPGADVAVTFSLPYITRTEYQSLLDLFQVMVLVRDPRQRQVYGIIQAVDGVEVPSTDLVNASFTVQQVSHTEVV